MKATTIISGYLVELDTDTDTTECFIDFNDKGTHYFASLAALQDTGSLEHHTGRQRRVPNSTIERIADWAISHGY